MDKYTQEIMMASEAAHKKMESDLGYGRILCSLGYFSKRCYKVSEDARRKLRTTALMIGFMYAGLGMPGYVLGKSSPHLVELIAFFTVVFSIVYYTFRKRAILKGSKVILLERRPIWLYIKKLSEETTIKHKLFLFALCSFAVSILIFATLYGVKVGLFFLASVYGFAVLICSFFWVSYLRMLILGLVGVNQSGHA